MDVNELLRPVPRRPQNALRPVADGLSRGEYPVDTRFPATLLALAGHDLRQPLQVITSAHDVLAALLRGKEQRKELVQAADATGQHARMLNQLVEALHLQERTREDLKVLVPLRPILDEIAAEFSAPARSKGIIFRVTTARGAALSHPLLLTSMVRNLVQNAIDYTPWREGFVASRRHGPELRIEVRDTGAGIRSSVLGTIFDAFRRADNTRADSLGLSLFIVKRAADLLALT
jgi:two-component system phosphate regulon sensor histidine kinase PhoR